MTPPVASPARRPEAFESLVSRLTAELNRLGMSYDQWVECGRAGELTGRAAMLWDVYGPMVEDV